MAQGMHNANSDDERQVYAKRYLRRRTPSVCITPTQTTNTKCMPIALLFSYKNRQAKLKWTKISL